MSYYLWRHYPMSFRGKSGTIHILTDAGHAELTRILDCRIAIRGRVVALESREVSTPFIASLLRLQGQSFGYNFCLEDVLDEMHDLEDIASRPVDEWWKLYLDMLDRIIASN